MNEYALLSDTDELIRIEEHPARPPNPAGKPWRWVPVTRGDVLAYQEPAGALNAGVWTIAGTDLDLAQAKDLARAEVTAIHRGKITYGALDMGGVAIRIDLDSYQQLVAAADRVAASGPFRAVTKSKQVFAFDETNAPAVRDAVKTAFSECVDRETALYDLIDAAADVPALRAIDIASGWPV